MENDGQFGELIHYTLNFLDCTMAYSLLSRIEGGLEPLLLSFEKYITTVGKEIILGLGTSVSKVGERDATRDTSSV